MLVPRCAMFFMLVLSCPGENSTFRMLGSEIWGHCGVFHKISAQGNNTAVSCTP
jgi:hypothetical protein